MRVERWIDAVHAKPYTAAWIILLLAGFVLIASWTVGIATFREASEVTVQRAAPGEVSPQSETPGAAVPVGATLQLALGVTALSGGLGMLAFKGYVRRVWSRNYFDYDVFRLVVRMRGAATRQRILRQLQQPMNRHQLARELGMDWKSVDRHVELLMRHGLLEPVEGSGERAYRLSERGRKLLELLEEVEELERERQRFG